MGDGIVRVLAPNPSPMTFHGTNSYILGHEELAVIDPGPDDEAHLAALLAAIGRRRVAQVIVTHSHLDHSPLAARLAARVDAPVVAFGDSQSGRSEMMQTVAQQGLTGGGEGIDLGFRPDECLPDGAVLAGADWSLEVLHTPGHLGNHICLRAGEVIFSGDHVMGWASSLVSPPDGDLSDFMAACRRLRSLPARRMLPGHGLPIDTPAARLDWLIAHREMREAQILATLAHGATTPHNLAAAIYTDVAPALHPAAVRNVFAHLIDLTARKLVFADPVPAIDARFGLI